MQKYRPRTIRRLVRTIALATALLAAFTPASVMADQSAVILMYHRFGEDTYPSTNIRLEQFDAHLEQLRRGGYHVMPLHEVIRRIRTRTDLPERSVAITVDDAYASVMTEAWPRLKAAGMPMTLFVAADAVDSGSSNYMRWDDIRRLRDEGVTIANHGAGHLHMLSVPTADAIADIQRGNRRLEEEVGAPAKLFAYPYGEYDETLAAEIATLGYEAAFAQYSAPVGFDMSLFSLPRFALNERYGTSDRFRLISQTLPLPVSDQVPRNPVLDVKGNPPAIGFTVEVEAGNLAGLACYPSHLGRAADLVQLGRRVEVRFDRPFPAGRNRLNCTLRSPDGRWYWYGKMFYVPGGILD
ncbi:polysaccharide deacetylase family protein [Eilatimonas milleporae]|uniref:Chitooligosaccharide deacetylase n=1 Tax=Eilatimonas milleporae TaxID=911205 RepID=A0A3M0C1V1_9PROT|nr:polysaccharide deacetylase family protein [Eilatimonas milleporae]RMB02855.1 polysaccharide deacetylase [Eilatimonas milleporae]